MSPLWHFEVGVSARTGRSPRLIQRSRSVGMIEIDPAETPTLNVYPKIARELSAKPFARLSMRPSMTLFTRLPMRPSVKLLTEGRGPAPVP